METRGGNRAVALELFRAALECMRLTERQELATMANDLGDPISEEDDDETVYASEDCLLRADMILREDAEAPHLPHLFKILQAATSMHSSFRFAAAATIHTFIRDHFASLQKLWSCLTSGVA
jgi:hypothetical protein